MGRNHAEVGMLRDDVMKRSEDKILNRSVRGGWRLVCCSQADIVVEAQMVSCSAVGFPATARPYFLQCHVHELLLMAQYAFDMAKLRAEKYSSCAFLYLKVVTVLPGEFKKRLCRDPGIKGGSRDSCFRYVGLFNYDRPNPF